jgi:hypothetical protein
LYKRITINQCLDGKIEELILEQLKKQKEIIENPQIPVRRYNYSCAAQTILKKDGVEVSYQTIINKAKQWGYYKSIQNSKKPHDRVVYTQNAGQLIQHDSSHHLFGPFAGKKWYLITSIDDFSHLLLEARFI